jgi:hypothetical protein
MDLIKTAAYNHSGFSFAILWRKFMKPQSSTSSVHKNMNYSFIEVPEQKSYVSILDFELMFLCSY